MTTKANVPPSRPSEEADRQQLALARAQGEAFEHALDAMRKETGHAAEHAAGDYVVTCAVEEAEGMYMPRDGELTWQEPTDENAHIEIAVRDAADGRFVPGLSVTVTVLDASGREIGSHEQPFLWHSWLYHYGRNWRLPGDGQYTIKVRIASPSFGRHDRENGRRFATPVDVEFAQFEIETGQKK